MYGEINRGYGVLFQTMNEVCYDDSYRPLFEELVLHDGEHSKSDISTWHVDELYEYIQESKYCTTLYSGAGETYPSFIGCCFESWPYWELEGPNGIMAKAQLNTLTDKEIQKWNNKVPKAIREILEKHGFEPKILWIASTS